MLLECQIWIIYFEKNAFLYLCLALVHRINLLLRNLLLFLDIILRHGFDLLRLLFRKSLFHKFLAIFLFHFLLWKSMEIYWGLTMYCQYSFCCWCLCLENLQTLLTYLLMLEFLLWGLLEFALLLVLDFPLGLLLYENLYSHNLFLDLIIYFLFSYFLLAYIAFFEVIISTPWYSLFFCLVYD